MIVQSGILLYTGITIDGAGGVLALDCFSTPDFQGDQFGGDIPPSSLGGAVAPEAARNGLVKAIAWCAASDDFPTAGSTLGRLRCLAIPFNNAEGTKLAGLVVDIRNDSPAVADALKLICYVQLSHTLWSR